MKNSLGGTPWHLMTSSNKKPQAIKENPRTLAVEILNLVEDGAFAQPLLDSYLSRRTLEAQDRGLLTQIVYGTLRLRGRMDWVIRAVYTGDFQRMEPGILNVLRVALYQIMCADRVPAYAATNEAVKLAKLLYPGRSNLVNAILRNAVRRMDTLRFPGQGDPLSSISVIHSHPKWLVRMWIDQLGIQETRAFCESNNEIPPLAVRANLLKTTTSDLIAVLEALGCRATPSRYAPDGIVLSDLPTPLAETKPYREGKLQIQDEASQLISVLLDPKPGEAILDVCAGVGIKTTHIAQLMKNSGRIIAMDISTAKIPSSQALSKRLGATIIEPMVYDATQELPRAFHKSFDRVLVDVPCSGLGTLRRNPEIRWHAKEKDLRALSSLQGQILNRSAASVNAGGILVYSTCTISSAENEDIVKAFLDVHPDFETVRPSGMPPEVLDGKGMFRTFPHRHGTDGFFGAVLKRKRG